MAGGRVQRDVTYKNRNLCFNTIGSTIILIN